jgi:hypothetical protein
MACFSIIIIKMGLATDDLVVCAITFKWTVHYMSYKMDLEKNRLSISLAQIEFGSTNCDTKVSP